jgi:hypothetical protein
LRCEDQIYILTTAPAFTCLHTTFRLVVVKIQHKVSPFFYVVTSFISILPLMLVVLAEKNLKNANDDPENMKVNKGN